MDGRKYRLSIAAKASGWDLGVLRAYFQRGHFEFHAEDEAPAKTGAAGYLSFQSVIALALARRLVDIGATPRAGFLAGLRFAYMGTRPETNIYHAERGVGELFDQESFSTLLTLYSNGESNVIAWPRHGRGPAVDTDVMLESLLYPRDARDRRSTGSAIVAVDLVLRDVLAVLAAVAE